MKRILCLLLAAALMLALVACSGAPAQDSTPTTDPAPTKAETPKTLKVLTLGHSLAVDSGHMLALVAAAEGYDGLTVGTLYYSGCPLYLHVDYLTNNTPKYALYLSDSKNPAPPTVMSDVTMYDALRQNDWDIIVMQAGTFENGDPKAFQDGNIQTIQNYVNKNKLNPDAIFAWNMIWTFPEDPVLRAMYPNTPNHYDSGYLLYGNSREVLYNAFCDNVRDYIMTDDTFKFVIPSGTALENALTSYMEEADIHRDYAHASDFGRVIASYTWYCRLLGIDKLTEIKLDTIPAKFLRSTTGAADLVLTDIQKAIILESVNNALANPLQKTQSQYTEAPAA